MKILLLIKDKPNTDIEKKIKKSIGNKFCCSSNPIIFEIEKPSVYVTDSAGLLYLKLKKIRKRKSDYSIRGE